MSLSKDIQTIEKICNDVLSLNTADMNLLFSTLFSKLKKDSSHKRKHHEHSKPRKRPSLGLPPPLPKTPQFTSKKDKGVIERPISNFLTKDDFDDFPPPLPKTPPVTSIK